MLSVITYKKHYNKRCLDKRKKPVREKCTCTVFLKNAAECQNIEIMHSSGTENHAQQWYWAYLKLDTALVLVVPNVWTAVILDLPKITHSSDTGLAQNHAQQWYWTCTKSCTAVILNLPKIMRSSVVLDLSKIMQSSRTGPSIPALITIIYSELR